MEKDKYFSEESPSLFESIYSSHNMSLFLEKHEDAEIKDYVQR
jgi:hypothetical protein